jgi:hypothetical protein
MRDVRFVKGAKLVSRDEAARSAVLVAGTGITEPSTVHAFDSEEAFQAWVATSPAKKPLLELDERVARARAEQPVDGRVKEVADRAVAGLHDLAERCALQPVDDELLRRATTTPSGGQPLFPSLMVLFDAYGLSGGWRPVAGTAPVLDWIGFDDRTSSVWLAGAGVLGQHPWFGGQRIYLLGVPFARYEDLRAMGFDNRASSAAVL